MFKELYYWMSTRLAKIESNDDPQFNGYFIICFLQSFNIGTLIIIVNYFAKIQFAKNFNIYFGIFQAFVLFIINYYALYKKRDVIFKKFENTSFKRKKRGLVYFWFYVITSTVLFFVAAANLVTPHN